MHLHLCERRADTRQARSVGNNRRKEPVGYVLGREGQRACTYCSPGLNPGPQHLGDMHVPQLTHTHTHCRPSHTPCSARCHRCTRHPPPRHTHAPAPTHTPSALHPPHTHRKNPSPRPAVPDVTDVHVTPPPTHTHASAPAPTHTPTHPLPCPPPPHTQEKTQPAPCSARCHRSGCPLPKNQDDTLTLQCPMSPIWISLSPSSASTLTAKLRRGCADRCRPTLSTCSWSRPASCSSLLRDGSDSAAKSVWGGVVLGGRGRGGEGEGGGEEC